LDGLTHLQPGGTHNPRSHKAQRVARRAPIFE